MKPKIQHSSSHKRIRLLKIGLIYIVGLNGCHPCSVFQCGSWAVATAQKDNNGDIVIDIPKINYSPKIIFISIDKVNEKEVGSNVEWSIIENSSTEAKKIQSPDFPLQYGLISNKFKTQVGSKKLTNGIYRIRGEVYGVDGNGKKMHDNVTGKFKYCDEIISNN